MGSSGGVVPPRPPPPRAARIRVESMFEGYSTQYTQYLPLVVQHMAWTASTAGLTPSASLKHIGEDSERVSERVRD